MKWLSMIVSIKVLTVYLFDKQFLMLKKKTLLMIKKINLLLAIFNIHPLFYVQKLKDKTYFLNYTF